MVINDVVLAAIPRSGSTLACHLLNQSSNCLAMVEPLDMSAFTALSGSAQRTAFLEEFFNHIRTQVRDRGEIPTTILEDETNTFTRTGSLGRRSAIRGTHWIRPSQTFADNFTLVVKHPNAFSALIGELKSCFSCYALIRNPLAILASWSTLDHPLREGHAPVAEEFDTKLQRTLACTDSALNRQLALLNWYFQQFNKELKADRIIKYENVIETNGAALAKISGSPIIENMQLDSHNQNSLYNTSQLASASAALLKDENNACWNFYTKNEVQQLGKHQ